jgi:hypothetical protein
VARSELHPHESAARPDARSSGAEPRMGGPSGAPVSQDGRAMRAVARVIALVAFFGAMLRVHLVPAFGELRLDRVGLAEIEE